MYRMTEKMRENNLKLLKTYIVPQKMKEFICKKYSLCIDSML